MMIHFLKVFGSKFSKIIISRKSLFYNHPKNVPSVYVGLKKDFVWERRK